MKIAILGGSGKLGRGLAARLEASPHSFVIGSRDSAKGRTNAEAADWCEIAIVAIPYQAHRLLLEPLAVFLQGKIVIDATAPLDPADPLRIKTETGTSAAEEAAGLLKDADVYAAFQTVSHRVLQHVEESHDVLVAGPPARKSDVLEVIRSLGLRPVDAGALVMARILESLTPLLISINKQNKVRESGIHIVGLPGASL
jgi:NADPH-dependent F420 reductase